MIQDGFYVKRAREGGGLRRIETQIRPGLESIPVFITHSSFMIGQSQLIRIQTLTN